MIADLRRGHIKTGEIACRCFHILLFCLENYCVAHITKLTAEVFADDHIGILEV